jgi:L-aspartate oxidase
MRGGPGDAELPPPVWPGAEAGADELAKTDVVPDEADTRRLMWRSVGLFRDHGGLTHAVNLLEQQRSAVDAMLERRISLDHAGWRTANIVTVAALIARAALRRRESRGGHFRTDFPVRDDLNWTTHISDVTHSR